MINVWSKIIGYRNFINNTMDIQFHSQLFKIIKKHKTKNKTELFEHQLAKKLNDTFYEQLGDQLIEKIATLMELKLMEGSINEQ